ncbi:M16 family metallopeptidase [Ghiorsea bivora]|uniref:M16 family metallopeptidase n=1 Tax=Ghiorsea bivora TaxID=1485545 RepID=UPI00056E46D8|nr:pitrilysin family protein [Ghiorsea bivora]
MRKLLWITVFFLSFATTAQAELQQASFNNGVKLIVEEDHSAPVAMVQVWLKVGGRDEVPGKTGLAHVFEHMMFKGSKKLAAGEYSKIISAMGGNDNAFTSTDYTAYFETVPAAEVNRVLKMEAERFANLKLRDKDFQSEIKVIMEERRMRTEDDANSRMFEELSAASLRLHPYRNPVIGWMQDLQALTIDDVRAFYNKHYVSANVTVVVVGDVDFKQVKKVVGKTFGKMKKRAVEPRFNPTEPEPLGAKRVIVELPAQLPMVAFTLPVPSWVPGQNDKEAAALALATEILAGGKSAVLHQVLVNEQRSAAGVGAGYDPFTMGLDLWYAYGALGIGQNVATFETNFWALISDMGKHLPNARRFAAAKRSLIANAVFAQDSLYLRAKHIGILETVGIGAAQQDKWLDLIRAVKPEDVRDVIARWLKPNRATTGILQPKHNVARKGA